METSTPTLMLFYLVRPDPDVLMRNTPKGTSKIQFGSVYSSNSTDGTEEHYMEVETGSGLALPQPEEIITPLSSKKTKWLRKLFFFIVLFYFPAVVSSQDSFKYKNNHQRLPLDDTPLLSVKDVKVQKRSNRIVVNYKDKGIYVVMH